VGPEGHAQVLLHETVVLLRGVTGVSQPIPGSSQHLHSHSRTLQRLPLRKEEDLWKLYSDYGASPRSLFLFAHDPDRYREIIEDQISLLSPTSLQRLLRSPNKVTKCSNHIITTVPSPENRFKSSWTFASPYALKKCCELLLEDEANAVRGLYDMLHNDRTTSTAAGMVFEHCVHQFLRKEKTIALFPILGRLLKSGPNSGKNVIYDNYKATIKAKKQTWVNLPKLEEFVVIDESKTEVKLNTYYHPKRRNFPSIDSWVLIWPAFSKVPIFIMFQITINKSNHDVKQEGLDFMDRLNIPANAVRWLVVLTPKGLTPQIGPVEAEYLKSKNRKRKLGAGDVFPEDFLVYHYPIDLALSSGPYSLWGSLCGTN